MDRQMIEIQIKTPTNLKTPLNLALKNAIIFHICIYQGIVTSTSAGVSRNSRYHSVLSVLGMGQGDGAGARLLVSKQSRKFRDVRAAFEILGQPLHVYLQQVNKHYGGLLFRTQCHPFQGQTQTENFLCVQKT